MSRREGATEGHPDTQTWLPGVAYFFLGNGYIAAAVQHSPQEGTPLGLLLMDPASFGPKQAALSMHRVRGLEDAQFVVGYGGSCFTASADCTVEWDQEAVVPTVRARWRAGGMDVEERFFCPDQSRPRFLRTLRLSNRAKGCRVHLRTGLRGYELTAEFYLASDEQRWLAVEYTLSDDPTGVSLRWSQIQMPEEEAVAYWRRVHRFYATGLLLEDLFARACWQVGAVSHSRGRMAASLWQYPWESVRDHSMAVLGLLAAGHHERARALLEHVLGELVCADGAPWDAGQPRPPELAGLDQNGVLLAAVYAYVCWTGDVEFARQWWTRLVAVAEYPFRFRAERAFLVCNQREYWGRMPIHGVEEGFELAYQAWMAAGWAAAARLAARVQDRRRALRWGHAAVRIQRTMLAHPSYRLIEGGRLIKRRRLSGELQQELNPTAHLAIPSGAPLCSETRHWLNPDASTVWPIVLGLVEADSALARSTLEGLEELWNQRWTGGGYGRYHSSSELDVPGAWPVASLLIARAAARAQRADRVWRVLHWLESLPQARSGAWFEFYGFPPALSPPHVGIPVWQWSELLQLLLRDIAGVWAEEDSLRLFPWLLEGVEALTVECLWRGKPRRLHICRGEEGCEPSVETDCGPLPYGKTGVWLPEEVTEVECRLPPDYGKIPSWK